MTDLDHFEDHLIERFNQHPVLAHARLLSDADLIALLLQRRFLSFAFSTVYDLAIDMLQDETSIAIARRILREEYPDSSGHSPSHREDLRDDLLLLGATRRDIATSRPTSATLATIDQTLNLVADSELDEHSDLRLLTILRFWGEVLVAAEYSQLWPRMAQRLTHEQRNRSHFYYPHLIHDAKKQPLLSTSSRSSTHADRLAIRLKQLLTSDEARTCFVDVEQAIFQIKRSFYDQFIPMIEHVGPSVVELGSPAA